MGEYEGGRARQRPELPHRDLRGVRRRASPASPGASTSSSTQYPVNVVNWHGTETTTLADRVTLGHSVLAAKDDVSSTGHRDTMRFGFVHAADLHLDTPFEGIGRVNARLGERLRDASLDAFDALVELTIDRGAEFLVIAGDVYDGADRGLRAQLRFLRGLRCLAVEGIPAFVAHGNHDPLEGWSAVRGWPPNVTLFGADAVAAHGVERAGERLATVYGVSYPRRDVTENLALRFRRSAAPGLHVGVLHCNVGAVGDHAPYSPCTLDDLRRAGMDYWALGHVHDRRVLAEGGRTSGSGDDPWVVYPGNLQGRSTKPSEQGAKGATVVHVNAGAIERVEFVACDRLRFVDVAVDVGASPTLPDVEAACLDKLGEARGANPGVELIARVRLTGHGAVHRDLRRAADTPERLLQALRDEMQRGPSPLWCDSLRDETRAEVDLDAVRRRGDFASAVVQRADALCASDDALAAFCGDHVAGLTLGDVEPATGADAQRRLVAAALEVALGALAAPETP